MFTIPADSYSQVLDIFPHMGIAYQYFYDMRTHYPLSLIMLGNPFVRVGFGLSAPSGGVAGEVKLPTGESLAGLYVSAHKGEAYMGRTKTDGQGRFRFDCLPVGRYSLRLNVNALETKSQDATVEAERTTQVLWNLGPIWRARGRVHADQGMLDSPPWVEMAARPKKNDFVAKDLLGIIPDEQGRFEIVGCVPLNFWLRGCSGKTLRTEPYRLVMKLGTTVDDLNLRVTSPAP